MAVCDYINDIDGVYIKKGWHNCNCPYGDNQDIPLSALLPQGFCPELLHAVIPYCVTLSNNGWMRWVKRLKNPDWRKDIPEHASNIKNMNRLFYNEVIVQCPNPKGVVAGIGPIATEQDRIRVRIIDVKGDCQYNMKVSDTFVIPVRKEVFSLSAFYRIYPYIPLLKTDVAHLLKNNKDELNIYCNCKHGEAIILVKNKLNRQRNYVPIDKMECGTYSMCNVSVECIQNPCRYHDSLFSYKEGCLAPKGLCPDAFHCAYPFALALLYDADFLEGVDKDSVSIICPYNKGITMLIKREERHSWVFRKFIKFLEKIFEFFFYPVDRIYNAISITITENKGGCPKGYHIGEKFYLNIRDTNIMCPASFNSVFPQLVKISSGCSISEKNKIYIHCPDCQGAKYLLERYT